MITRVDVYDYSVGYVHGEYVMSGGRAAMREVGTLVRVHTSDGIEGWGEITPLGGMYLPTFAAGLRPALAMLGTALIGADPLNNSQIHRIMDSTLLGQSYAKSALDIACWDIRGKALGVPISQLIGGVLQGDFPIYEAVPLGSPESMAEFISSRRAAGIKRFQLKVGNDPYEDAARARASVEAGDSDVIVIADSNGGWNLLNAQIALRLMEDLPIFIEQPCRSTEDCIVAMAHSHSSLPLVLDESIIGPADVFRAKEDAGAVSLNIKFSRVGGLTQAVRIRDLMQDLNLMVSIEDMWGGDVITAAVSHVAATTRPESLLMTSFFNDWTDGHIAGYQPRSANGRGAAPTAPGLGIEVDKDRLGSPLFSV